MLPTPTNAFIADLLDEVANLLEVQQANPFQVAGWRSGADAVRGLDRPAVEILSWEGRKGLIALDHIGRGLASAIEEIAHTGGLALLERLRGAVSPEDIFTSIPGIGEELATRIHEQLHIETLEELERAAHDGTLLAVPGVGERRAELIKEILAARLARSVRRRARWLGEDTDPGWEPPVWTLLEVDRHYRRRAVGGELPRITPRRFNPENAAWLPLMHEVIDGWHFTAMYSNTARAHALGRTDDWVVIYYYRDGHEAQCTVVTERRGQLSGLRVVRGRELECQRYYRAAS